MCRRHAAALVAALLLGCGLLTVRVEQTAATTVEGAGLVGQLLGALEFTGLDDFDVTFEQELENQGVAEEDVTSVVLTQFTLSTPTAGADLSFIEAFDLYVAADGLDRVRVAHGEDFPEGVAAVDLELDEVELQPYVVAPSMTFETEVSGSAPVDDVEVEAFVVAEAVATAAGACGAAGGGG